MDDDAFWELIESSGSASDCETLASALQARLEGLPVEGAADFCHKYDASMDALYTWKLWGVAYIINGGCSDDGFEYFRCGIMAHGRQAFELAMSDPEGFGLSIEPDSAESFDCEALLYAGHSAFKTLTGEYGPARSVPHPASPAGEAWDEEAVGRLFPRLWERWANQ